MVKYSIDAIGALLRPIRPIHGRPTFGTLYKLNQRITECLRRVDHPNYPDDGFSGYMLDPAAFRLFNDTPWEPPPDVGEYFSVPATAITETEQKSALSEWQSQKDLRDTFKNVRTALKEMLERTIEEAYHSATMGRRGFGNDDPPAIVARLQRLYGKPSLQEIDTALARLLAPMDRNQPIEVMLREIEEVQLFLLSHPDGDQELPDHTLILHAMIKLNKTGAYVKLLERWNAKPAATRRKWMDFRLHAIAEYERLLAEGAGVTAGDEGYPTAFPTAFHTTNVSDGDDTSSLAESVVRFAERASEAELKVGALEERLSAMETSMEIQRQQDIHEANRLARVRHTGFFAPLTQQTPQYLDIPGQGPIQGPFFDPHGRQDARTSAYGRKKRREAEDDPAILSRHRHPPIPPGATPDLWTNCRIPNPGGHRCVPPPFSNAVKRHNNLLYCYSCGYDVDHDGYGCTNPKVHHVPSVTRAMAHTVPRASMKAQHKTLPDGTGAGMGWILSESIGKASYIRDGKSSDSFVKPPKWKPSKEGKGKDAQQM
jgi:hypothetical protein